MPRTSTRRSRSPDVGLGNPAVDLNKWFLSVQDAMALGNKSSATRVGLQLHAGAVTEWFRKAGLETARVPEDKPNVFNPEPMTLGDVAALYQVLGNDGIHRKLKIIQTIESRTGQVLYDDGKADKDDAHEDLLNSVNDRQLTLTLQNALRSGPARNLASDFGLKAAVAGMPGYSEGYRDAWFVGYTPKLVTGVWVGYDDSRPIGGKDMAVKSAVPLWGDIMQQVEARLQDGRRVYRSAGIDQGGDRPVHRRTARTGGSGPGPGRYFCLSEEGAGSMRRARWPARLPASRSRRPRNGATG